MKRTLLTCLILMAIGLGLFVSCNAETVVPDEDGVAYIRFGEDTRRGDLTASYKTMPYDEVYWFYTAKKTDKFGKKGQTDKLTPVAKSGDSPAMGLGGYLSETFSQGTWEFTLQAYTSGTDLTDDNLVYKTKEAISVTLLGGESKVIGVSVEPMQKKGNVFFNDTYFKWSEKTGNMPFFKMEATSGENKYIFTNDSVILDDKDNTGKSGVIELNLSAENNGAAYKVNLKNNSTSGVSLATGTYQCDVTAYVRKDGSYSNTNVAKFTFWFAVYGSASTTITGDLTEGVFSHVKFAVKERVLETLTVTDNAATFGSKIDTTATAPSGDAEVATKKQEQPKVVMDFSGIKAADGTNAVTSATLESEVVVGAEAAEGFKVVDTTKISDTEKAGLVVASISLTAKDQNGAEIGKQTTAGDGKTGGFGKAQTITKFIGPGLNGGVEYKKGENGGNDTGTNSLKIYYNNKEEKNDIVVTAYNPTTGYITFTTTHFSTFVIVDTSKFPVKVSTITTSGNQNQATETVKGYYTDLAEAFAAKKTVAKTGATNGETEEVSVIQSGDTITIQQNTSVDETIVIDKDLTLDLGGKTISSECRVFDVQSGTFTIQSTDGKGTVKTGGTIEATISESGSSAVKVSSKQGAAVLNLESSATIKAPTSYGITALKDKDGTYDGADKSYTAVLNIKGTIESGNPCVGTNGSKDEKVTTTMNILEGAVLTQDASGILTGKTIDRCAVYQPSIMGTLNISGGSITSKDGSAVEIRAGKGHTISGGTLTSNADIYIAANGSGPTVRGAAVAVSQHTTEQPITLTISGGKFNAKKALSVVNPQNNATDVAKTVVVTVANSAIADKDIDAVKVDGKYYPTFEAAVEAAKGGATITLLGDRSSGRNNLETKDLKVVLNGHTLTGTASYGIVFCPKNGHTITIDGTEAGSTIVGTVMCTSETTGNIVVEGGTYIGEKYSPFYVNGAAADTCNVTIKNAKIITSVPCIIEGKMYNSHAIYLAGPNKTTLTGCSITGVETGVEVRAGNVAIENCNITGNGTPYESEGNTNGTTTDGVALAVAQHTTNKAIDVKVAGGSLSGVKQLAVINPQSQGADSSKLVKVTVSNVKLDEDKVVGVRVGTDTYYPTLEGAIADGATNITLMSDITLVDSVTIDNGKSYVVDLNGHTISKDDSPFIVKHGSLELTGTGTVQETMSYGHAPIMIYGSTNSSDKNYSVVKVGSGVTLKGWAGLWINITDKDDTSTHHAYGVVVDMKGKIVVPAAEDHVSTGLQGIYLQGLIKDESGNVPEITLDGAEITSSDDGLYAAGYAKWIIKDTTINAPNGNGLVLASGEFEISGDTKIVAGTVVGEQESIGGSISSKRSSAIYVKQHNPNPTLKVAVKGGSFYSYIPFYQDKGEAETPAPNKVTLSIEGGSFVSNSESGSVSVKSEDKTGFITGGTFSTEPAASYIANGYAAVKNETSGTWTVKTSN